LQAVPVRVMPEHLAIRCHPPPSSFSLLMLRSFSLVLLKLMNSTQKGGRGPRDKPAPGCPERPDEWPLTPGPPAFSGR
jgi:hypothetical protein